MMPVALWKTPFALTASVVGAQFLSADALMGLPGGGWLAVTRDTNGGDHADVRRFAADGAALGSESPFSTSTTAPALPPSLGRMADGRIVAAWANNNGVVTARFLDANGAPDGQPFTAASLPVGALKELQVVGLTGGGFALAGETSSNDPGDAGGGIRFQVYGSNLAAIGTTTLANTTLTSNQSNATVAALANGGFLVAWNSGDTADGQEGCLRYRRFDAAGTPVGGDAILNTLSPGSPFNPEIVTLADGRLLAVWGYSTGDVYGRFLSSAGVPQGSDVQLPMGAFASTTALSTVISLQAGGFLVVIVDIVGSVRARVFDSTGAVDGSVLVLATSGGAATGTVSALELADGRVVVGWNTQVANLDWETRAAIVDPRGDSFTLVNANVTSYGSEVANTVQGTSGADLVFLLGGNDTFNGNDGDDAIYGGSGDDQLNGDGGNDFIVGGAGADAIVGGAGFDAASWLNEGQGVVLNLTNQTLNALGAAGDVVQGIGAYYLTNFADSFTNAGGGGYIYGFDGADTVIGGAGSEFIDGGAGADTINGGAGFDYVSYANAAAGVRLDFTSPATNTGEAAGDVVSNVEAFYLTAQGDIFIGQSGQNIVFAGNGGDNLFGGVNANDWLFGEGGADFISGGNFDDLLSGGSGADTYAFTSWVGNGFDSILDFVSGQDKVQLTGSGFGLLAGTAIVNGVNFIAAASPFATSAQGTLLYATGVGILYYDPDGSGAGAAIALAQIAGAPTLLASDFIVA